MPTEYRDPPTFTLAEAEFNERHHLEMAATHQTKAKAWGMMKQAILAVTEPEPNTGHDAPDSFDDLLGSSEAGTGQPEASMMGVTIPTGTKKWNCLNILAIGGPKTTAEIVAELNKRGFTDTTQSNTSPQLSLYGKQELIRTDGGRWHIRHAGRGFLAAQEAEKN